MESQRLIRSELVDALAKRRKKSVDFHEQDLAKEAGIHSSTLSLFLSGDRNLSRKTAITVMSRMRFPKTKQNHILRLMEIDKGTRRITPLNSGFIRDEDEHEYASNPDLVILLHLMEATDFDQSPTWVSKRIRCKKVDVPRYFKILNRLNLIKKEEGKWVQTGKRIDCTRTQETGAFKEFRADLLSRMQASDANSLKDYSLNWTICMDPNDVPKFEEEMRRLYKRYAQIDKVSKKKHVYSLFSAVTPMTFE